MATRWQNFLDWGGNVAHQATHDPSNPFVSAPFIANDVKDQVIKWLNTDPAGAKAAAKVAPPPPSLQFGNAAEPAAQSAPLTPDDYIANMFPGIKISSAGRTKEYQADMKKRGYHPADNSMHLITPEAPNGFARDLVISDPKELAAAAAKAQASGVFTEVIPEGDHLHLGWRHDQIGTARPTVTTQQAMSGGVPVNYVDPGFAMGMVPDPRLLGQVHLPSAPQRQLPGEIPPHEQANREEVLAQLASVIQPKAPDTKFDKWDRIAALLQGAATGAASADPHQGFGQFLLRAGAGGAAGFRSENKDQKAERDAYDEKVRQAQVALAKMGIDIDLSNLTTRNVNVDRKYTSGENVKDVKFSNANATFETNLKQVLTNLGINQQNVGALNSRDMQRSSVGLSALSGETGAQNQANLSVLNGGGAAGMQGKGIDSILVEAGVPATGSPFNATARGTAAAILANDVDGALQNFSQELVATGAAAQILAPDKGDSPEAAKVKMAALRALKQAKKAGDPQSMVAAQAVAQLLSSDHAAALAIAKTYSSTSPSARIILLKNTAPVH